MRSKISDKKVEIALDSASDLFNVLKGEYLARNVSRIQYFTVPADNAVLLVVTPTNSVISYSKNKTFIDNNIVAYDF